MSELGKERKKNKEDNIEFNSGMADSISLADLQVGRIPIPQDNMSLEYFTIYQPDITETIKNAYEGLFRIWEKQGKYPIEELDKLEKGSDKN